MTPRRISLMMLITMPAHLVRFLKPTDYATKVDANNGAGIVNMATVINLPEQYQKHNTTFQLQFHYDPKVERQNQHL
jgi:hypothetical protein